MNHSLITKGRPASGAIAPYLIGAVDTAGRVKQATAATDKLLGVVSETGADAAGQIADVHELGLADVRAGAAFADGVPLTTNASGKAVAAALVASSTVYCIGFARQAADADGDIVPVLVSPFVIVG